MTRQSAFVPQAPMHGSTHFCLLHASVVEQSRLTIHSGWQFGGAPRNPGRQVHTGRPSTIRHSALDPHTSHRSSPDSEDVSIKGCANTCRCHAVKYSSSITDQSKELQCTMLKG